MRNWEYLITFSDPCSAYMYHLVSLHHDIVWYLIIILIIVLWSLYTLIKDYGFNVYSNDNLFLDVFRNNTYIIYWETYIVYFIFNFFFLLIHISFEVLDTFEKNSIPTNLIIKGIHYFCILVLGLQGNIYNNEMGNEYLLDSSSIYRRNYNGTYINNDIDVFLRSFDDFMYWYIFWKNIEYLMRIKYSSRVLGHNHLTNHFYNGINFSSKYSIMQSRLHWFYFKTEYAYMVGGSPVMFSNFTRNDTYTQLSRSSGLLKMLSFQHSWVFEAVWAGGPSYIVGTILSPSLSLIYANDVGVLTAQFYVKVIGSQWFWDYELSNWYKSLFSSRVNEDWVDLEEFVESEQDDRFNIHRVFLMRYMDTLEGEFYKNWRVDPKYLELSLHADLVQNDEPRKRLLETTSTLILPTNTPITFFVTATDVLHSWAVPNLGLKIDAVPGRLNEVTTVITSPGLYTGQCSELCGVGHGFMPIRIIAVSPDEFTLYAELSAIHSLDDSGDKICRQCIN